MCRLFGFRSIVPSAVHRSLLDAENALGRQSARHPDGWGVAYYVDQVPHLIRSAHAAHEDALFQQVSGVVASETVVAHVRKATAGALSVLNSHPFQHGRWVFAHNGEIPGYAAFREPLRRRVPEPLRRFVLGATDSEVCFFLFLAALAEGGPVHRDVPFSEVLSALRRVEREVEAVTEGQVDPDALLLNFMVSNGEVLVATRRGKELYWSTHKERCADRDVCPHLAPACETPARSGPVSHLVVSSEPVSGDNVWQEVPSGGAVGVDARMQLVVQEGARSLPIVA